MGTSIVQLAMLLVPLAALLIAGGEACAGVRSMTWNETCLAACPTPELYNLCKETLQHEAVKAEVTVYVIAAARRVARSYDDTVDKAERLIVRGALNRDEREVYQRCIGSYGTARTEIADVVSDVASCEFKRTGREYKDAVAAVEACGEELKAAGSPLGTKNASDRDLTTVAAELGSMVLTNEE